MDHQTHRVSWTNLSVQFSRQIQIGLLYNHSTLMGQALNGGAKAKMEASTLY